MPSTNSVSGWLLDRVVQIDVSAPGLAGAMFRCSNERRHVVACYLSLERPHTKFDDEAALGSFLIQARHHEILRAAFGSVPVGMRGALRRADKRTHPRRFYGYLFQILASDSRSATRALIAHLPRVNPAVLKTSRALSSDLQSPSLVATLRTSETARTVSRLVVLLEGAGVDRAAMCRVLTGAKSMEEVVAFASNWAFRAELPTHPVPQAECYIPIKHGADLKRLARRYRNCMANMLANVLDRRSAFALIRLDEAEAVVHLVSHRGSWQLLEICGPKNTPPSSPLRAKAASYLKSYGIEQRRRFRSDASKWQPLRRLVGRESIQIEMEEVLL